MEKIIEEIFISILQHYKNAKTYHFIFDSYIGRSLKGGERIARLYKSKGIIHLGKITNSTKVPKQMQKFWKSDSNKEKLQYFAKKKNIEMSKLCGVIFVLSGIVKDSENPMLAQFYNIQT